jgi:hypothetical protein
MLAIVEYGAFDLAECGAETSWSLFSTPAPKGAKPNVQFADQVCFRTMPNIESSKRGG